ncbi:hypothetical protein F4808DRAFT_296681 [Astrocystis sublimbata]|nr:hypothetical protein F4808DRAFT_296681 [Astrocystis sublimbata]
MSLSPEQIQYFKEHASDSYAPALTAVHVVGLVFAFTLVGLRVYARRVGKAAFAIDDWLIVAALVPLSGYVIGGRILISYGNGRHIIFVTNVEGIIKGTVVGIAWYALCIVLTKLSILCFYCRVFFPAKNLVYISWAFGIFITAYSIALVFVAAFQCIPLSSIWTGKPGMCIDTLPPYTALSIINLITDVGILVLPIRYIIKLQMSRTRRIQICGIFLLGALVTVFGIIRIVTLAQAAPGDPTYNQIPSGIWSFAEISSGIVGACLPTIAVLVTRSYFLKVSNSLAHLLPITFRRSRGGGGSDNSTIRTKSRGQTLRPTQSDEDEFVQLAKVFTTQTPSNDSRDAFQRMPQGRGDMSTFVSGGIVERGENIIQQPVGVMVKSEVIHTEE